MTLTLNLTPGTYTVAEVPQPGWTRKRPAPAPPGTWMATVVGGQETTELDFGNQQNPVPPLPVTTPPSSTPDTPPHFTSTPPNPGTAEVGVPFLSRRGQTIASDLSEEAWQFYYLNSRRSRPGSSSGASIE
jgi:hypothetical protein